jgi:cyclophilin family peptidyl-prolyl cis-trans isomerase
VGTAKRERQKANRQVRLEQMAKQARTQKNRKRGLLIGIGLPVLIALIFLVAFLTRDDGDDGTTSTTVSVPTSESVPVDSTTTPTVAGGPTAADTTLPVTVAPETLPAGETPCPAADGSSPRVIDFAQAPPMCIDATKSYSAKVTTNLGDLTIELDPAKAPNTVNNFVVLARYHYFDNTVCHRAITGFMVQCGDPTGTGSGPNPGYEFANENPAANSDYVKGAVAMANAGPDTNGSQFFITTSDSSPSLETNYSLFGQVTDGLDTTVAALDSLGSNPVAANGVPPSQSIVIESVTITES